jgi:DNA-directed RNA polymerase specialized sigma24 family protein
MGSTVQRKKQDGLTENTFASLLEWLDRDRDTAGQKYEIIRLRLIKIFTCRGCSVPEELADATVDRVATKVGQLVQTYVGEPALYFYNVAEKIYLEYARKARVYSPLPHNLAEADQPTAIALAEDCFGHCMEALPERSRELILAYYRYERSGRDKLDQRKALAEQLAIADNALWIRVHRIRLALKKCMKNCMQGAPLARLNRIDDSRSKQK